MVHDACVCCLQSVASGSLGSGGGSGSLGTGGGGSGGSRLGSGGSRRGYRLSSGFVSLDKPGTIDFALGHLVFSPGECFLNSALALLPGGEFLEHSSVLGEPVDLFEQVSEVPC